MVRSLRYVGFGLAVGAFLTLAAAGCNRSKVDVTDDEEPASTTRHDVATLSRALSDSDADVRLPPRPCPP
jgi:hypothetical protein